ncbi:MAG: type II toxin-antitoxin system VapC family toxin [Alphaproteobacteria bacterium]|nr:type II toxin-antitoxin system VapC family toxin [Alphaproteobacteria bacterium]
MTLVIDANVAIALALPQPYSAAARAAIGNVRLIAPDLLIHETANVLSRLAASKAIVDWEAPLDHIQMLIDELVPSSTLAKSVVRDALSTGHPAYDLFYAALARDRGATLVTADQKLARQARVLGIAVTAVR